MRTATRIAGIVVVALIVFVFALQMTFPYDRVRAKIEEALAEKYDVTIGGVDRGFWPGRVYFNAVSLRTRATQPGEPVTTFYIEKLEVDMGIFALIRGVASIDLDAKIGAGHIKGNVSVGKNGTSLDIKGTDLPGGSLPMRAVLGLPMTGKIEFDVSLDLPNDTSKLGKRAPNWAKAEGKLELSCPSGCTFGDGHTKLKPILKNRSNQVMVADGIDFGQVNVDSLMMKAEITPSTSEKGTGKLEVKQFDATSKDGELHVDYMMALEHDFAESLVTGCLRFKGSPSLEKREPKTYAAITTTGAELHGDGLFHIKLTDKFKDMKRLNLECGPNVKEQGNGENFGGAPHPPSRPNLTVQPEQPVQGTTTPPPIPTAPPPPIAAPPPAGSAGSAGSAVQSPTNNLPSGFRPGEKLQQVQPPPPAEGSEGSAGSGEQTGVPQAGAPVR